MADANWLRKTPPAPELDEDPFAELTRIMGFDPREPYRGNRQEQAPLQVAAAPRVEASDEDLDLSLDLEQELIGALDSAEETAAPVKWSAPQQLAFRETSQAKSYQAPAAAPEPEMPALDEEAYGALDTADAADPRVADDAAEWAIDEAAFADYVAQDATVDAAARDWTDASAQAEQQDAPVHQTDEGDAQPAAEHAGGYDADWAGTDVAAVETSASYVSGADAAEESTAIEDAPESAEPEAQVYAASSEDDDALSQHAEWGAADEVAMTSSAAESDSGIGADDHGDFAADHDISLAAELDQVLSASFEDDAAYDGGWAADQQPELATPQQADEEVRPFAPLPIDHFASDFDDAMAEVDMDFSSAEPALPEAAWSRPQHEPAHGADEADRFADARADLQPAETGDADQHAEDQAYIPNFLGAQDDGDALSAEADEETRASEGDALDGDLFDGDAFEGELLEEFAAEASVSDEPAGQEEAASRPDAHSVTQSEIDDAIAELAAMVRGYDQPESAAHGEESDLAPAADDAVEFLDIDTIDVPESAVALADDLDIPEIEYAEDDAPVFDDLDAELAAAFGEPAMETVQPAPPAAYAQPEFDLDGGYDPDSSGANGFGAAAVAGAAAAGVAGAYHASTLRGRPGDVQLVRRDASDSYAQGDFEVEADPELEQELAGANAMGALRRAPTRRGLVVASVVGGVAIAGVIGAFAFSGGNGIVSGEPVVIKADTDPVKVRPENPGGTEIANQTNGVFDRAAGEVPAQPQQPALISTQEEPVDVAARFAEPEPVDESADIEDLANVPAKAEDRIDPVASELAPADEDTLAVPPRKVRTMIVKPDGSLVPREDVAADEPATVGSTTAAGSLTDPSLSSPEAQEDFAAASGAPAAAAPAVPAAEPNATAAAGEAVAGAAQPAPATADASATRQAEAASSNAGMPDRVPVAPSRPADQPLDIVGEVKPDQVASLDPQAGAIPPGTWSMQIASQPSEAAAQKTFQDLSRKYSSVLAGRSANIVKAEIDGKGTFWRVRVPAGSRNEAIALCESYKSAGGNCFVSK